MCAIHQFIIYTRLLHRSTLFYSYLATGYQLFVHSSLTCQALYKENKSVIGGIISGKVVGANIT